MRKIKVGDTYKHFKGMIIEVLAIGKHSETLEEMVVYKHVDSDDIWVRPMEMFNSLVDKEKYPEVMQKYRFEKIEKTEN